MEETPQTKIQIEDQSAEPTATQPAQAGVPEEERHLNAVPDARRSEANPAPHDEGTINQGINEELGARAEHAAATNDVFDLQQIKEDVAQETPASTPPPPDYNPPQPPAAA